MFLPAVEQGNVYRLAMLRVSGSVKLHLSFRAGARQGPQKRGFPINLITAKPGEVFALVLSSMVQECAPLQY
jgi:hypothetical protein